MKNFGRYVFSGLMLFYLSNLIGIIHVPLDFSWFGLLGTVGFSWLLLERFDFPGWIWITSLAAILLDAVSDIFHLYSRIEPWDKFMHLEGGFLLSFPLLILLGRIIRSLEIKLHWFVLFSLTLSFVAFFGILYEVLEYSIDRWYFGFSKALGDGPDTVEDLILNLVGGGIGFFTFALFRERLYYTRRSNTLVFS